MKHEKSKRTQKGEWVIPLCPKHEFINLGIKGILFPIVDVGISISGAKDPNILPVINITLDGSPGIKNKPPIAPAYIPKDICSFPVIFRSPQFFIFIMFKNLHIK